MSFTIETENLSKIYGEQFAVNNVNLYVKTATVYGYLGANGAGKTTTIRMLLSMIYPTSGAIRLFGKTMKHFSLATSRIGFVPGEMNMYEELTGMETLNYYQSFLKNEPVLRNKLISDFQLSVKDLNKKVRYYSQGMKQKIMLIQAMQHDPDLLILDEPSEALDPLMQQILYSYIYRFRDLGKTVFFSSHNLPEVEKVSEYIGIIKNGKLMVQDEIQHLKGKLKRSAFFKLERKPEQSFYEKHHLQNSGEKNGLIEIIFSDDPQTLVELLKPFGIKDYYMPDVSLEKFFMSYYLNNEGDDN